MALCAGIKADGGRCGAQAMRNSQWCINHDPDKVELRRQRASKGGKRGGRGRPSVELARLQARFEDSLRTSFLARWSEALGRWSGNS
jgi:hypothetical protein